MWTPDTSENLYKSYFMIITHNQFWKNGLKPKKKIEIKKWSRKPNSSLLNICILGAWDVHQPAYRDTLLFNIHYLRELSNRLTEKLYSLRVLMIRDKK